MPITSFKSGTKSRSMLVGNVGYGTAPVAGYSLWLDASDTSTITVSGTAVTQWTDKGPNTRTFTQGTAGNRPVSGVSTKNSLNVIDFDGSTDFLESTAATSVWKFLSDGTEHTYFVVAKSTDLNFYGTVFGNINSQNVGIEGAQFRPDPAIACYMNSAVGSNLPVIYNAGGSISANEWVYAGFRNKPLDATAANRSKGQIKLGTAYSNNTYVNNPDTGNPTYTLIIGGTRNNNGSIADRFAGSIAEIIMYSSYLSDGDTASVQSYLANKWGI
jgi:hypothetical protein